MAHEIREFDNMFSVGKVPWHGLGVVLKDHPDVDEAIKIANLNWEVDLAPIYYNNKNNFKVIPGKKCIVRGDTGFVLGTVSRKYKPLQNNEAFEVFRPLVESKEILLETAGSLKNGKRVWILGKLNIEPVEVTKNDPIVPFALLSNSHDGLSSVRFGFTPIRVVCNNTLSSAINHKESKLIRIYHKGAVIKNVSAIRDIMDMSRASFNASIEQYKLLAKKTINNIDLKKYVRSVFDIPIEMSKVSKIEENVYNLYEIGLGSIIKGNTLWKAYNAVNEYLNYERGRSEDNRMNSLWFADGYDLNKHALDTALTLLAA